MLRLPTLLVEELVREELQSDLELKPMHKAKGYVAVAATPVQFPAKVETIIAKRCTKLQ